MGERRETSAYNYTMPRSVEDIRGDIDEIKKLLEIATRSTVKDALTLEMRRLETAVSLLLKDEQPVKPTETSAPRQTRCYDVKLTDYAWDQSDKFVKLFVTLKSVGTLAADKISCTFTERSVELSVKELLGRNYSLPIKNLLETIDPSKSHWKVKPGTLAIRAHLFIDLNWEHIIFTKFLMK